MNEQKKVIVCDCQFLGSFTAPIYLKYYFFDMPLLAGRFSLKGLYESIGFNKEVISRGKYAELNVAEQRPLR